MMQLLRRQVMSKQEPSPSTRSYDHRWLLFLIPICLLFIALLYTIWYVLRRRKKQRQRRSILRNRSLVAAEHERQQQRQERRLSRGNSISSRLSRFTSVKSSNGRSTQSKKARNDSATGLDAAENGNQATQVVVIGRQDEGERDDIIVEGADEEDDVDEKDIKENDVEDMAEATAALPITLAYPEPTAKVRKAEIARVNRPAMTNRKELSAIGELPGNNGKIAEEVSRKNASEMTGSSSHSTNASSNPFQSPTPSSSGHQGFESPISPSTFGGAAAGVELNQSTSTGSSSSSSGGGLGRKLSGVIRLRQPSPAGIRAPSSTLQRSDSRASHKSSVRSFQRMESNNASAHPPLVSASWAYTSKAAQWKSSSTDVSAPGMTTSSEISSEQVSGSKSSKASEQVGDTVVEEKEKPSLATPIGQLARKPSTGVAGSRFVESFDEY